MLLVACLAAIFGGAILEAVLLFNARRAIPVRIHVNGTRGKSTVTRLIWAALREAGYEVLAKSTGTEPRLLLPDGTERPIRRRGRANIREQIRTLWIARRKAARAVVVECMAVDPELQWVSEHRILKSTIGVITNVRLDHTDSMGGTRDEIASCLANTIPRGGVLILGEPGLAPVFESRAALLGTRVVTCAGARPGWLEADEAVALVVTRELGIGDAVARAGMARVPHDPGALATGRATVKGRTWDWLDARAANDPESLALLLAESGPAFSPASLLPVYNHRADRPSRLRDFARAHFGAGEGSTVWITGSRPQLFLWRSIRRAHSGLLRFVPPSELGPALERECVVPSGVVFCGNTRGLSLSKVLERINHG